MKPSNLLAKLTSAKLKHGFANLVVVVVAIVLGFLIVETAGHVLGLGTSRIGTSSGDAQFFQDRTLFITGNSFITDEKGAVKFMPNQQVRYVTVWGKEINFDKQFSTNNLGFVQKQNVEDYQKKYIAFVGDSFTEGHGEIPWFYNFETNLSQRVASQEKGLLNLGVSGTGFPNFQRAVFSIGKANIKIDKVAIIFISDNLLRPYFTYQKTGLGYLICYDDAKLNRNICLDMPTWWLMNDIQEQPATITEKAQAIQTINRFYIFKDDQEPLTFLEWLMSKSIVIRAVSRWNSSRNMTMGLAKPIPIPDATYQAMDNMVQQIGKENILLIHIPQKEETAVGKYYDYSKEFTKTLEGIAYFDGLKLCGLKMSDYHKLDPHPNKDGYQKIEACIRGIVEKHLL